MARCLSRSRLSRSCLSLAGLLAPTLLLALPLGAPAVAADPAPAASVADGVTVLPPEPVWPQGAPAWGNWPGMPARPMPEELRDGGDTQWNVTIPTFQPFLPDPARATGAAVIVAPGGGFRFLSIRKEGVQVAQWLAERGIAAFVLRYRLIQILPGETNDTMRERINRSPAFANGVAGQPATADGIQALRQVRASAARFGIDPHRVGVVGFSAGGHVAALMAMASPAQDRPDFAGLIYGMPFQNPPPALPAANLPFPPGTPREPWLQPRPGPAPGALPPLFMAGAQDDMIAGAGFRDFYEALHGAGYRPELHLFYRGSHGFGMKPQGSTSDHWIEEFGWWIEAQGLTRPAPKP